MKICVRILLQPWRKWHDNRLTDSSRRDAHRSTCIVGHLHDPIKKFLSSRFKLLLLLWRNLLRSRDGFNERIAVEGIYLIENHNRNHQPIAHLGWGDGSSYTNNNINVQGARGTTDGIYQ